MKKRTEIANDVAEIAGAAGRAGSIAPRGIDDMEELSLSGAKEIATLTVIARSQDWQFKPLMEALEAAAKITDWSHPFLVAHDVKGDGLGRPRFSWRDSPFRRYANFKDFYARELETTWGKWEDLQRTWSRIIKGEITEDEARQIVARRAAAIDAADRANQRPAHRPKSVDNNSNDIHTSDRPSGTSAAAAIRRLRKDRPDIHARVLAGELSPHAGMIEAGFRKKNARKALTRVERTQKTVAAWTKSERRALWQHLNLEFGKSK